MNLMHMAVLPQHSLSLQLSQGRPFTLSVVTAAPYAFSVDAMLGFDQAATPEQVSLENHGGNPQRYTAHLPVDDAKRFNPALPRAIRELTSKALQEAASHGARSASIEYGEGELFSEPTLSIPSIMGGINAYAQHVHAQTGSAPYIADILLNLGKSVFLWWQGSEFRDLRRLIQVTSGIVSCPPKSQRVPLSERKPQSVDGRPSADVIYIPSQEARPEDTEPILVDLVEGILPPDAIFDRPRDTKFIFRYPKSGKVEEVYLVGTGDYFRKHVRSKKPFTIYQEASQGLSFLYLTHWKNVKYTSPHDIINSLRGIAIRHYGEKKRSDFFEKGYIKPLDDNTYLVYDLGGSPYHNQHVPRAERTLNRKARAIADMFETFGIRVTFEEEAEPSYGPR